MIMSNYGVLTADTFLCISDMDRFCRCVSGEDLYVMGARFLHTFYGIPNPDTARNKVNPNRKGRVPSKVKCVLCGTKLFEGNRE